MMTAANWPAWCSRVEEGSDVFMQKLNAEEEKWTAMDTKRGRHKRETQSNWQKKRKRKKKKKAAPRAACCCFLSCFIASPSLFFVSRLCLLCFCRVRWLSPHLLTDDVRGDTADGPFRSPFPSPLFFRLLSGVLK